LAIPNCCLERIEQNRLHFQEEIVKAKVGLRKLLVGPMILSLGLAACSETKSRKYNAPTKDAGAKKVEATETQCPGLEIDGVYSFGQSRPTYLNSKSILFSRDANGKLTMTTENIEGLISFNGEFGRLYDKGVMRYVDFIATCAKDGVLTVMALYPTEAYDQKASQFAVKYEFRVSGEDAMGVVTEITKGSPATSANTEAKVVRNSTPFFKLSNPVETPKVEPEQKISSDDMRP
jgi:hypothetical protein